MKNYRLTTALLVAGMLLFQTAALAEIFQGTVSSTDPASHLLVISYSDPASGAAQEHSFSILPDTELKGINSLEELKAGDPVTVDAQENKDSASWEAKTVTKG